jgi:SprT protein
LSKETIARVLAKYLPPATVGTCTDWIVRYNIHVRITRTRASKLGDYRPSRGRHAHEITINHDLNPYAFLITFIHEIAHLQAVLKYPARIAPHGREWKREFAFLLEAFAHDHIFPGDVLSALKVYLRNPAASSCSDHDLLRALRRYDQNDSPVRHLEDLPPEALFRLHASRSGQVFKKGPRIRTRYHCLEIRSQREYFVSPLAEVILHGEDEIGGRKQAP